MSDRLSFPDAPIDGRVWHAHRKYLGIDHGCEITWDHRNHEDCPGPHSHEGVGHMIDILRDAGVTFAGDPA